MLNLLRVDTVAVYELLKCVHICRQGTYVYEPPKREDFSVKNIEWLTIEQFTPEGAEAKINEFVKVCATAMYRLWTLN